MKYVSECAAAKQVSAYVILNPQGKHVATLRAFHGGTCIVNVFHVGNAPAIASLRASYTPAVSKIHKDTDDVTLAKAAHDKYGFQVGRAPGYGYDKFTAALSGMIIDGHKMTDHSAASLSLPEGMTGFPEGFKAPPGYALANWRREEKNWMSCYRVAGLKYLEALGYDVIYAI